MPSAESEDRGGQGLRLACYFDMWQGSPPPHRLIARVSTHGWGVVPFLPCPSRSVAFDGGFVYSGLEGVIEEGEVDNTTPTDAAAKATTRGNSAPRMEGAWVWEYLLGHVKKGATPQPWMLTLAMGR
eukprot:jgi/Undpi1/2578/HiC_scaffold_13.g05957.m1